METLDIYFTQLAGPGATPGGGSAAMVVAAAGAALVAMVTRITSAKPKFTGDAAAAERLVAAADGLRATFLAARDEDEAAFAAVVTAQKRPKDDPQRAAALAGALAYAAEVPLRSAASAVALLQLAKDALAFENPNLISDTGCAAAFGLAAFEACAYNVRINHKYLKDPVIVAAQAAALSKLAGQAHDLAQTVRRRVDAALP